MPEWQQARLAARKMGLRDLGSLGWAENDGNGHWVEHGTKHQPCNTVIRLGSKEGEVVVKYCWRCEVVVEVIKSDKPRPRLFLVKR